MELIFNILFKNAFSVQTNQGNDALIVSEIIEPEPIAFSFDAPGWYLLGLFLILISVWITIRSIIKFRKNAYRREAINEIELLDEENNITEVLRVLKIVAIKTYGRISVAELSGSDWFDFLEKTGKNSKLGELQEPILNAYYRSAGPDIDILSEFIFESKKWIKTHA